MLLWFLSLMCSGFFLVQRMSAHVGSHDKPFLYAWPSYVVPLGQNVTLTCDSHRGSNIFKLYKEEGSPIPQLHETTFQKSQVFGPVTTEHAGTYRCFHPQYANVLSAHSEPLKIIISGIYLKPFLLILQSPLVNSGGNVTLECHSENMFDTYILISHRMGIIKNSVQVSAEHHESGSHVTYSIGPMTPDLVGTYTCYGANSYYPYEWSDPSDPIDIKITGVYKKPSLSVLMGPVLMMSGETMTLSCISDHQFDMFHMSREGVPQGQGMPGVQIHSGKFEAKFLLSSMIQKGNYRCYGSFRNSSHVWSSPSDPLYLPAKGNCPACTEEDPKIHNCKNLRILTGLLMTMVLVIIIIFYSCYFPKQNKSQKQAAASMEQESEVKKHNKQTAF
ncbi:killer cell immunoglobulin-like receptor, three domains, long cytoplasmic tail, 2 precursor [Mus musculus]|uniref:KIR-like receptor 2 KIRL2.1 n=1 Tax=Mus musculus TaxID=10090 RepID=Q673W2_MOUSE|nr:killer cell immunoglobulin-like receptor, three domains, long cytoplasmic tail, 2 precursor [Mus musculus]AAO15283.1 killer immunoglobulin-like receptor-like 2 [Mus musculus]AAO15284.1 killer immunoglobulin-like receptor-like 2 [Mus musculus]AAT00446.1 KIR-like receptor 2 precursor KIRL2.1 [Mus musculus]|eukprot:NP_808416.1 killer cell immunoglobulin-like receptor, three domains, long cytoplasmic tail, 2 precursor [Mus musculus]